MKYKRIANALLALVGVDIGLWTGLILVGLYGCNGVSAGWCAVAWVTLTAFAVIGKICIGVNLINPTTKQKAAQRLERRKV